MGAGWGEGVNVGQAFVLLTGFTPNPPLSPALARGVRAQIHRLRQSLFNHLLTRAYVNAGLRGFIP